MFYIIQFVIVWTIWLIFADKKRWRELFPVGFLAAAIASMADTLATHYGLWNYHDHLCYATRILDNLGIYIVAPYLFVQWFPKKKTFWRIISYWIIWTVSTILIEVLHLQTGHMTHGKGWNVPISFFADCVLLAFFYGYYKLFRFERLSRGQT